MAIYETVSFPQFTRQFPDEEAARLFLETKRWGGIPHCSYCGSLDIAECKDQIPMPYRCKSCRKHFSVRTGTILSESRIPLYKWLLAIYILTNSKKGVPTTLIAKELCITPKNVSFITKRIRETWLTDKDTSELNERS